MALEFVKGPGTTVARLGVLPGTFNPPTRAHLALADAALAHCDEVLFVLPRALPHKDYSGVGFQERLKLLGGVVAEHPRYAAAASDGGLFVEIAKECRSVYGREVEMAFLCGRDAAERIVGWKYELIGSRADVLAAAIRQLNESRSDACVMNGAAYGAGFGFLEPHKKPVHVADKMALCAHLAGWLEAEKGMAAGRS